jgi:hypothetical protein
MSSADEARRRYAKVDRAVAKAQRAAREDGGQAQAEAARLLKAQDKGFKRIGGQPQLEWMESPARTRLAVEAGPEASKAAHARYVEYVTGIHPGKFAKDVDRELRKMAPQQADAERAWVDRLAKATGSKAAQERLYELQEQRRLRGEGGSR